MNEQLRDELIAKKLLLTYDEWWDKVKDAFIWVHNPNDPKVLYEEYVNEIIADYEKIESEKKK